MVSDSEDPESAANRLEAALERIAEAAADRLETALERIAQAAVRGEARPADQHPQVDTKEVAARLDAVINRLRAALGRTD